MCNAVNLTGGGENAEEDQFSWKGALKNTLTNH